MAIESKRVYELAKEYGMNNKDFIEFLGKKLGIVVKSHSSNLTPVQINKINEALSKKDSKEPVKKPKAFVIKKAKPVVKEQEIEPKTESIKVKEEIQKQEEPVIEQIKEEIKEEPKETQEEESKEEQRNENPADKAEEVPNAVAYNNGSIK